MPEDYTWRVEYRDGSELLELDPCTEHEAGRIIPGSHHNFACVDPKRAVAIELVGTNLRVDTSAPSMEPVFFRRRVREAAPVVQPDGTVHYEDQGARSDLGATWIGWRRFRDDQTEPCAEALLVILADGRMELRADSVRAHG